MVNNLVKEDLKKEIIKELENSKDEITKEDLEFLTLIEEESNKEEEGQKDKTNEIEEVKIKRELKNKLL